MTSDHCWSPDDASEAKNSNNSDDDDLLVEIPLAPTAWSQLCAMKSSHAHKGRARRVFGSRSNSVMSVIPTLHPATSTNATRISTSSTIKSGPPSRPVRRKLQRSQSMRLSSSCTDTGSMDYPSLGQDYHHDHHPFALPPPDFERSCKALWQGSRPPPSVDSGHRKSLYHRRHSLTLTNFTTGMDHSGSTFGCASPGASGFSSFSSVPPPFWMGNAEDIAEKKLAATASQRSARMPVRPPTIWAENADPNFKHQVWTVSSAASADLNPSSEGEDLSRERKKIRARRYSTAGSLRPLADLPIKLHTATKAATNPSFSHLAARRPFPTGQTHPINLDNHEEHITPSKKALDFGDLVQLESQSSPAPSVASSSRKRGVSCAASPTTSDPDEVSSTGGLSVSHTSSSSRSMRRICSRSRIFVNAPTPASNHPMTATTAIAVAPPLIPATGGCLVWALAPPLMALDHVSSHERNIMDIDSDNSDDSNEDDDRSHHRHFDDDATTSSPDASFEGSSSMLVSASASSRRGRPTYKAASPHNSPTNDKSDCRPPCYADLKFIIKALRQEEQLQQYRLGIHSWSVVPSASWDGPRRSAFLLWATRLGFTVRSMGGNAASFVQIPQRQGPPVLQQLEDLLLEHKRHEQEQQQEAVALATEQEASHHMRFMLDAAPSTNEHSLMSATGAAATSSIFLGVPVGGGQREASTSSSSSSLFSHFNNARDESLSSRLEDSSSSSFAYQPRSNTIEDEEMGANDDADLTAQLNALSFRDQPRGAIIRHVTMEKEQSKIVQPSRSSYESCSSRPSLEGGGFGHGGSGTSTRDLMLHMHGYSPSQVQAQPLRRPPTWSLGGGSVASSRSSFGTNGSHAISTQRSLRNGCTTPYASSCVTTATNPSTGFMIVTASSALMTHQVDVLETPLNHADDHGWGSCPFQGRDWGLTEPCDDRVMRKLREFFEESGKAQGLRDSFGSSSSCVSSQRSSNLTLDLEADAMTLTVDPFTDVVGRKHDPVNADVLANEVEESAERRQRRLAKAFAKSRRMTLVSSSVSATSFSAQKPLFRASHGVGGGTLTVAVPRRGSLTRQCSSMNEDFPFGDSIQEEHSFLVDDDVNVELSFIVKDGPILANIFSYLTESELLTKASIVCTQWANAATTAHAHLLATSVGGVDDSTPDCERGEDAALSSSTAGCMERSWSFLNSRFPWGCFLSEGAYKRVYKVFNANAKQEEALSVMDIDAIHDKKTVAAELAISAMLSSLARRGICPNFVLTRGVFTCAYEPSPSFWGTTENKRPRGAHYAPGVHKRAPKTPRERFPGRYQYIRMELCKHGDAEELLKRQPGEAFGPDVAQALLFQLSIALHAGAHHFSLKHYDVKLLNVFVQSVEHSKGAIVLRYGLGSHAFAIRMPPGKGMIAKLADFGTANIKAESNGQPVTLAQFTTLENTPPDFMILGDESVQGHGHDNFGLGLCMLHLFTGHAPYEEILESVKCPPALKKRLRKIWEDERVLGYDVMRSVILSDAYKDDDGNIVEGEPDDTLYDTLYRFLVLFDLPTIQFRQKQCPKVWQAISDCLEGVTAVTSLKSGKSGNKPKPTLDASRYLRDRRKFSLRFGSNKYIARARISLESMKGGMDLLFQLCAFDPEKRASALSVLNSPFMENLREDHHMNSGSTSSEQLYGGNDLVLSYTAFSTHR